MSETIDYNTFTATLTDAFTAAIKDYPHLTPVYLCYATAEVWREAAFMPEYQPIDPEGRYFHDFVKAKLASGRTVKSALPGEFIRKHGEVLFAIFSRFRLVDSTETFELQDALYHYFVGSRLAGAATAEAAIEAALKLNPGTPED